MPSAPKSFGSQLQLNKIPILGIVVESSASAPSAPVDGQFWYDTSAGRLKVRESGAWALASLTGAELSANKGVANGYASLNSSTQVPLAQLPVAPDNTSSATQVVRADDSRLSNSRTPSGSAGGDLTGSYPSPTVANGAITDTKVAAANKDGAAGTASMRTLGSGSQQAMPGNYRLDQIAAPTAPVSMNNQRLTTVATPTTGTDAANKDYVDSVATGLDVKGSVRAASTANVTVTYNATGGTKARGQITAAPNTLDGVSLAANNRVLLKNQTTGAQNGIWVVTTVGTGSNGVWDRATDFDDDAEVTSGAFTFVEEGTVNDNSGWVLATNNPIVIGGGSGTALVWEQFSGAGQITAGSGLTKTGNSLSVVGTASRITVGASVDIASDYVGQTSITTLGTVTTGTWNATTIALANGGTGATTAAAARTNLGAVGKYAADLGAMSPGAETTITHNLGTTDVQATFRRVSDGYDEVLSWRVINTTQIGVTPDISYGASAVRVVVVG